VKVGEAKVINDLAHHPGPCADGKQHVWDKIKLDNGCRYVFCAIVATLFYASEFVSWPMRSRIEDSSGAINATSTDEIYDQGHFEDISIAQCVINFVALLLEVTMIAAYRPEQMYMRQVWFTVLPLVGLLICWFVNSKRDPRWFLQLGIDFCGYTYLILFWSMSFRANPEVHGWAKFAFRAVLAVMHLGFFLLVLLYNLQHESTTTFVQYPTGYLASILENILLFELLHLCVDGLVEAYHVQRGAGQQERQPLLA